MPIISPQQIVPNTTIDAIDINSPIGTIANLVNGKLDNANIADNAGISAQKIDFATLPENVYERFVLPSASFPVGFRNSSKIVLIRFIDTVFIDARIASDSGTFQIMNLPNASIPAKFRPATIDIFLSTIRNEANHGRAIIRPNSVTGAHDFSLLTPDSSLHCHSSYYVGEES